MVNKLVFVSTVITIVEVKNFKVSAFIGTRLINNSLLNAH